MIELTPYAENVLEEILSHRNENGSINTEYWQKKFNGFSVEEDELCRSCFKELSDNELIVTRWADNCPYHISITTKGLYYVDQKDEREKTDNYAVDTLLSAARDILKTEYRIPERGLIIPDYIDGPKYEKWKMTC